MKLSTFPAILGWPNDPAPRISLTLLDFRPYFDFLAIGSPF